VRAVAAGLDARGFRKGEVFAHYAPNLPEYVIAFHAVATIGGINTTANPLLTAHELAGQLRDCRARLLVTVPERLEDATVAAEAAGVEEVFVYGEAEGATPFSALLRAAGDTPKVAIDPAEDVVALPYSSGTTDPSKGVMLTHRNLVANICHTMAHQRVSEADRVIAVLPFFYIYGHVVLMNLPLRSGATVVTMPRFDLPAFLRGLREYPITRAWVVPPIVLALAKQPLVDESGLSRLELILSGAAPLSAELARASAKRLGCRMVQGCDLTETSPTIHSVPDDLAGQTPGSIGPPLPNTECRIVDVATGEDAPSGKPGEPLIRGQQVMKSYLNWITAPDSIRPSVTSNAFGTSPASSSGMEITAVSLIAGWVSSGASS
jgi:acyl-CoA synthetase (AMP-forming)/AMP-acid ligase II